MKKVLIAFGTRPEAIKMCPVIKELNKRQNIRTVICVSGQHRHLLDQVLNLFDISPDYDLSIMKDEQSLSDITTGVLSDMGNVLLEENPDLVLVHGDTTTAFATALAAFYLNIPVGHVEAGLRTYSLDNPFPEEFNRQGIGIIAKYNFAPTELAANNLLAERKSPETVFLTGNTIVDAMKLLEPKEYSHPELDWLGKSRMILITAHRRETIGESMRNMFRAIRRVLDEQDNVKAIYPIHLNPAVRKIAKEEFEGCNGIHLIEPLKFYDFHNFERKSHLVLTDSGGVQEECQVLGKPVLVMRKITERVEGIEAGTMKLVGINEDEIYRQFTALLENEAEYNQMKISSNIYGDGHASEKIVDIIEKHELR